MSQEKHLLIGSTGNLGSEILAQLTEAGRNVKAASRNPSKIVARDHVEPVAFSFEDPATFGKALHGVNSVFLMAPPLDPTAASTLPPFIDAAKTAGVDRIVFLSALGADTNEEAPLRKIERHLMGSKVPYTIIRPNFFMENFSSGFVSPMITQMGGIFLAAGDGKTSFISTKDIAAVAVKAMTENSHAGKEYNLTGQDALSHAEVAEMIGEVAGKNVKYAPISEEDMKQGALKNGMPATAVDYMADLYRVVRAGFTGAVTTDVEAITGRKPVTFQEFVRRSAEIWK